MAYLDNIAVFVRVVELGNLSAAGRDMRISPAVIAVRIAACSEAAGAGSSMLSIVRCQPMVNKCSFRIRYTRLAISQLDPGSGPLC